jgi:serine/threonine protein kinase
MKVRKILQSLDGGESIGDIKLEPSDYPAFFKSINNLFEGLEKAHAKDVIHNDIKPDNIVVAKTDKGHFNTRFIDFGISFKWDDLDKISKNQKSPFARNRYGYSFLDNQYNYWSIEVSFANPHPVNKRKVIHDFYKDTIKGNKDIPYRMFYKKVPGSDLEKAVIDETYLTWLEDKLNTMTPTDKYKFIFEKDDVFALGRTLSQIFYQRFGQRDEGMSAPHIIIEHNPLKLTKEEASLFAETVAIPFYKLVRGMMSPDIRTRFTMKEAGKMYNDKVLTAINKFFKTHD